MTEAIPTLSESGWLTDPKKMLEVTFKHMLAADYSQSTIYLKNVSSIQYIINTNDGNMGLIKTDLNTMLSRHFNNYFDEVSVKVNSKDVDGLYQELIIDVQVWRDGIEYSLGKSVEFTLDGMLIGV